MVAACERWRAANEERLNRYRQGSLSIEREHSGATSYFNERLTINSSLNNKL